MENYYTSVDHNELDVNMRNIVSMNMQEDNDDTIEDYDLDYDPNDFFYELQSI